MHGHSEKSKAAMLSVISNSILILFKLICGLLMGSVSVISEAIHSGIDLIAAIIALFAVRVSDKPSDEEHPYGHGKIENISGTIEALLIFVAGIWIIYEAVEKIRHPHPLESIGWGILVMLFATIANWLVSSYLFRVGQKTDSVALIADAWHLRTDVYTSIGVLLGLGSIQLGKWVMPSVPMDWLDPVVAIGVACLIIHAATDLTKKSAKDLLDARLPEEEERWVETAIRDQFSQVCDLHKMRTRRSGSQRFFDFHLWVCKTMTVEDSHRLSHQVSDTIKNHFAGSIVTIHIEPCGRMCPEKDINLCPFNHINTVGDPESIKE